MGKAQRLRKVREQAAAYKLAHDETRTVKSLARSIRRSRNNTPTTTSAKH